MVSYGLIIFCIITLSINSILCYVPEPRINHNSLIIHNRLLVFGGWKIDESANVSYSEMFYLDLTKPFDSKTKPWILVEGGYLPVYISLSTAIVSTLDYDIIYLIGGYRRNITTDKNDNSDLVYMYNYSTTRWTSQKVENATPRQAIMGVINNEGTIYMFGGSNSTTVYNDMQIFKVSTMDWSKLNIIYNLPLPCFAYTANILTNRIIVYIGGTDKEGQYLSMKTIRLFDTLKSEWAQMNVIGGDDITPRSYHSSVLTTDGYIILYGGLGLDETTDPKLAILDTNKEIYEWTIPALSGSSPHLYGHTANLYGNYMIVTFGYDGDISNMSSQIYLFDVSNYTWVTTFNPSPPITTEPTETNVTTKSALRIGLGVAGGVVLIILVSIGVIVFRRYGTKPHTPILKISGTK
ncbi:hypothetical protein Glove_116g47 [Diversispora epigaea]|uniref:Attractin/MKLN-like beta-propeller domain-containing protein n=1 Tax=Diversispora epigaea TaxID=1348612 RepID=A0A397J4P2_9GLOM|nr:hypothetical protein Glove_116g47 [Diversispora epigaea]